MAPSARILDSRWFAIALVEFEVVLGLWLLSGAYARLAWWAALVCFLGFAAFSLASALMGNRSCGCFGNVEVSPWLSLAIDVAAVGALLCYRPSSLLASAPSSSAHGLLLVSIALCAGISAAVFISSNPSKLAESGEIIGDSSFVILEPHQWIGRRFPLLDYIDIGPSLATGSWIVLLYNHDCSACEEAIERYGRMARADELSDLAIAFIELPPYGDTTPPALRVSGLRHMFGRISPSREWFVPLPVELTLVDGTTVRVSRNDGRPS
jgi:hypothetical protein